MTSARQSTSRSGSKVFEIAWRSRRVLVRIDRLRLGLLGDVRPVGGGISELRIDIGPGYRLYFVKRGKELFILLVGGDKGSQNRDIRKAMEMASRL